jgi:hypothetical protein
MPSKRKKKNTSDAEGIPYAIGVIVDVTDIFSLQ